MDFPEGFGRRPCTSWFLEEMRALPEIIPSLCRTGFYVGGVQLVLRLCHDAGHARGVPFAKGIFTRTVANLFLWSLRAFSKPPYGTLLKVEAEGIAKAAARRRTCRLSHNGGYVFTGVPVVACVLQYLNGGSEARVSLMGHVVGPKAPAPRHAANGDHMKNNGRRRRSRRAWPRWLIQAGTRVRVQDSEASSPTRGHWGWGVDGGAL